MAHIIVMCPREGKQARGAEERLYGAARLLTPDLIEPRPPLPISWDEVTAVVVNPAADLPIADCAICLGTLFGERDDWATPGSPPPDGSHGLVRANNEVVEVVADLVASRPLWYAHTDTEFLASSSQRALVALLGEHHLNRRAVTWMLASGTLGPEASWDERLQRIPQAAMVRLNRRDWTTTLVRASTQSMRGAEHHGAAQRHGGRSDGDSLEQFWEAVLETCRSLDLPPDRWVLPLSGGCDSRALLLGLLAAGTRPRCVTWGMPAALDERASDAAVARDLARALDVPHEYLPLRYSPEPAAVVFDRFVKLSEGLSEDLGAYLDGFALWKGLFEAGTTGIVRGDEVGFGGSPVRTRFDVRARAHDCRTVADYPRRHMIHRLGLVEQPVPEPFDAQPGESVLRYWDRTYREYYFPAALAPLNLLKSSFVEIANPLLSRRVYEASLNLPDSLRQERRGLKRLVREHGPDIPFATEHAPAEPYEFLAREELREALRRELESPSASVVLPHEALAPLTAALADNPLSDARQTARARLKAMLPDRIYALLRPYAPLALSPRRLALRAAIASRAAAVLADDARALAAAEAETR